METAKEVNRERPVAVMAPEPEAPPRRKGRAFVILGLVAAVVVVGILSYRLLTAGQESTDDAQVTSDIVAVGPRVSGVVSRVYVNENQIVKKGDLLVEIDPADLQARVDQAQAELETAQAQAVAADSQVDIVSANSKGGFASAQAAVSGSSLGVGSAAAQVDAAKAAVARAEADARKADLDLNRAKELRQANAVPQERLDSAQVAQESAKAALAQAKAQLALAEESRRGAEARVSEARGRLSQSAPVDALIAAARAGANLAHARVKSAQAALDLAKLQLSYTHVVSPADGQASKLSAREGQLISTGQPIIELVPLKTYVIANFKETQIGKMRPGDKAEIELDAFPGHKLAGQVQSLAGGTGASFSLLPPDNSTGNFVKVVQRVPVRIAISSAPQDLALRAGLSVDVTVFTAK